MNLNEQNEEFDMNLIGVDKMVTVQAYTNRDIYLNINYNTQIINSLKKLNYYNLAESVPRTLHAFKIKKLIVIGPIRPIHPSCIASATTPMPHHCTTSPK